MAKRAPSRKTSHERMLFTLPRPLIAELRRYAALFRGGNRSGFVADALRVHMDSIRKARHTARLRASYAASAHQGRSIAEEWLPLDEEAWALLEKREGSRSLSGKRR